MKVTIVVDDKKRLQKLSKQKFRPVAIVSLDLLNLSAFYCCDVSLVILIDLSLRS